MECLLVLFIIVARCTEVFHCLACLSASLRSSAIRSALSVWRRPNPQQSSRRSLSLTMGKCRQTPKRWWLSLRRPGQSIRGIQCQWNACLQALAIWSDLSATTMASCSILHCLSVATSRQRSCGSSLTKARASLRALCSSLVALPPWCKIRTLLLSWLWCKTRMANLVLRASIRFHLVLSSMELFNSTGHPRAVRWWWAFRRTSMTVMLAIRIKPVWCTYWASCMPSPRTWLLVSASLTR